MTDRLRFWSRGVMLVTLAGLAGCGGSQAGQEPQTAGPAEDTEPSEPVAVVASPERALERRVEAAIRIIRSASAQTLLEGGDLLTRTLDSLDPRDRATLAGSIASRLLADLSEDGAEGARVSVAALAGLRSRCGLAIRERIDEGVLDWMLEDFGRRAGRRAELVIPFASNPARAARLLDAMTYERAQHQLVTIARHFADVGGPELRVRAAARLVAIVRHYETPAFAAWLRARIAEGLADAGIDLSDPAQQQRIDRAVPLNRERFIRRGAIPALRVLRDVPEARAALEAIAFDEDAPPERRAAARAALGPEPTSAFGTTPGEAARICEETGLEAVTECAFRQGGRALPGGARVDVVEVEVSDPSGGEETTAFLVVRTPDEPEHPTVYELASARSVPGESVGYELGPLDVHGADVSTQLVLVSETYPNTGDPAAPSGAISDRIEYRVSCSVTDGFYDCEKALVSSSPAGDGR